MCSSVRLRRFLDLGHMPPADAFLRSDQLREPEVHYPLQVCQCEACGLIQLTHVVSPEILYRRDYPYEASITRAGRRHWREFADSVCARMALDERDLVVDVGSNVGFLLECFRSNGPRVLGIDPASNIVRIAESRGIETWDEFFGPHVVPLVLQEKGKAKVITATNVFAHVDRLRDFMSAAMGLLAEDGILIIEAPHVGHLIRALEYDTIYHEHLSYLSLKPLQQFFSDCGMEIYDVEEKDIHGGSFRIFAARAGRRPIEESVRRMLGWEDSIRLYDESVLNNFAVNVVAHRAELRRLLQELKQQGKRIAGVSAPAKGMTLLNYCHVGPELLDFVTEKSKLKIGRFTPGMHIPVLDDEALIRHRIDYALLLAWNFADEIIGNLRQFVGEGGRFIVPVPRPRIVSGISGSRHRARSEI
jgi:SAM-dependent methyltransferase